MHKFVYRADGFYAAFIQDNDLFSLFGHYLGWIEEDNTVWRKDGKYFGRLMEINGHNYILREQFLLNPLPRLGKVSPSIPNIPNPPHNIRKIDLDFGMVDALADPDGSNYF